MRIVLTHVSDRTFAGASHREVALALLAAEGWSEEEEGPPLTLDARYLGAVECLDLLLDGGRLVDGERVVADAGPGETTAIEVLTTESPVGAGRVERMFVDLLLQRLDGVVVHDPDRVWIEAGVSVAAGAVLWGGCVLRGGTEVGRAEIGPGAVLVDCVVDDGVVVRAYTVAQGARIGPGAAVGPMAHLRAGAVLEREVKVGNFVEVKKTTLREGAKASHLTYLGDAEIGAGANIGAGTITCNYDGFNKNRTVVGPGAFVGSNTSLVAPVEIGAGAIVGAGSAISHDVPADALAVERSDARILDGMAVRLRRRYAAKKNGGGE